MTASFLYSDFVIRASFVIHHSSLFHSWFVSIRLPRRSFSEGGWLDFVSAGRRSRDSLDRCGASVSRGFALR